MLDTVMLIVGMSLDEAPVERGEVGVVVMFHRLLLAVGIASKL